MPPTSRSFTTISAGGLRNVLRNECGISLAFDPATDHGNGDPPPPIEQFIAIWDTGATGSVVTQEVVDKCGLIPTGMAQVHGVNGIATTEVYLVNIYLPNKVMFPHVRVTRGALQGANILIGMDIICQGDFAVTNKNQKTIFSFRVPSMEHIDFVQQSGGPRFRGPVAGRGKRSSKRRKKR